MFGSTRSIWRNLRSRITSSLDRGRQARTVLTQAGRLAAEMDCHPIVKKRRAEERPFISLVAPVYNTPPSYLDQLLESFRMQNILGRTDGLFELVISDDGSEHPDTMAWLARLQNDPSVKIVINPKNMGIAGASNKGIDQATGEWVAFIDHDDALAPFALERIAEALLLDPEIEFLYTDEVIADVNLNPVGYFLKPAWDEVLLSGVNYINHLSVYRRERLSNIGNFRLGLDGSQDYDLLLRYTRELASSRIRHLPYPAYIWRRDGSSYSTRYLTRATENARKALQERYSSGDTAIQVLPALDPNLHRLDFAGLKQFWPKVSIIIPSRNSRDLISRLMEGLINCTDYPDFEVIVIDNGSTDNEVLVLYENWKRGPISFNFEINEEKFNFSRSINRGVALARGELFLLLNNDIEIIQKDWLKEMVSCLEYKQAGIVGAKLLYPNQTIQHAGVIVGLGGVAGHWFIGERSDHPGPMGRFNVRQSLSAVTGACFLISRRCWEKTGQFDETHFAIAYNDVDFCLRAIANGFRIVWTPFAELIHHESASRGSDETPENIGRFKREQDILRQLYQTDTFVDRAYNPWWGRDSAQPANQKQQRYLPPAR